MAGSEQDRLERAGFSLETRGDNDAMTVIAESPVVVFQLTEWPGRALGFHAISFAEDRVIPATEADNHSSVQDKCDYYLRQVEAYLAGRL
jgi:hypothetical protein